MGISFLDGVVVVVFSRRDSHKRYEILDKRNVPLFLFHTNLEKEGGR